MRTYDLMLSGWPGLPQLWLEGRWSGFLPAAVFTAWLNFTLVATFSWPDWISVWLLACCQLGLVVFWIFSFFRSCRSIKEWRDRRGADHTELFVQAQAEFLRGHWFEAEALLRQILLANERDVDSHLLLASLFRHTRRFRDARRQLQQLERIDGSEKWLLEIKQERTRIKQLEEDSGPVVNPPAQHDNVDGAIGSDSADYPRQLENGEGCEFDGTDEDPSTNRQPDVNPEQSNSLTSYETRDESNRERPGGAGPTRAA